MQLSSSTEWAINGNRSIKATSSITGYSQLIFCEVSSNTNESYIGQISILNNSNSNVYLRLLELGNDKYNDVTISSNVTSQEISISRTTTSSSTLKLLLIIRVPVTVYVDNVRLCKR